MSIPAGILAAKPASGGAPYVASAVHFDGSTWVRRENFLTGVTTSPTGLLAVWLKFSFANGNMNFLGSRATDTENSVIQFGSYPNGDFLTFYTDLEKFSGGTAEFYFEGDEAAYPAGFAPDTWVLHLCTWNTDFGAGNKVVQRYFGETVDDLATDGVIVDAAGAFNVGYDEAPNYTIGADGFTVAAGTPGFVYTGDMAAFQLWIGTTADLSVEATRRLFIDASGKPVDPATAAATLGAQTLLFDGNAAAFATNQGTGGAFTLTGSLTNASTSPSD